jgi:septum formation protein
MLLKEAGIDFEIIEIDYDETYPDNLKGMEIAEYLAREKAGKFPVEDIKDNEIIITADTVVWQNNRVLGKPADRESAFKILSALSGKSHEVITGMCIASAKGYHVFSESTRVWFRKLSDDEINFYISGYKPFDKAGAYGIQEWIGLVGNSRIEGSYFNVMGMPVHRLIIELRKILSKNKS